jgi:hypothetical protein
MKNSALIIFIWGLLLLNSSHLHGQIWKNVEKKIGKKIEQQADRRLERKIDKTIDSGFDKVENAAESKPKNESPKQGSASEDNSEKRAQGILSSMGKNQNIAPLSGTYKFNLGISYEITTSDKKQGAVSSTIWLSDNSQIGMSTDMQKSMFMVMDGDRMITFMEDRKSYMILNLKSIQETILKGAEASEDYKIEKVGIETLLGYKCDIYKVSNKDYESTIAIAPEVKVDEFMKSFASLTRNSKLPTSGLAPGMMLRMESRDKKKGDVTKMTAKEIHKTSKIIISSEYKSMGAF